MSRKHGDCPGCGGALCSAGRTATGRQVLRCKTCRTYHGSVAPSEILPAGHITKGVSTYVGPDGEIKGQWIKSAKEAELREEVLRRLLADLPGEVPKRLGRVPRPPAGADADLLAVYPQGDPHLGMLAWGEESGDDHDLKIGVDLLYRSMAALAQQKPRAKHALVALLGDTFHSDTQANVTLKSKHQLDVDTRWAKVLRAGLLVTVRMIDEALAAHDHVTVWSLRGNHDEHTAYMLAVALDAYYRNEKRVTVDLSPSRFLWLRFGRVLLGGTHGDLVKPGQLESIMASYRTEDWGKTVHRHWLTGHIHTTQRHEYRGCVVESFRTLAAQDAYAANNGYRSGRDAHRLVFHREHGEIARSIVDVGYLRDAS